MEYLPSTIDELIDELDRAFPEVLPKPGASSDELFYKAGQRFIVLYLKQLREDSRNN